MANESIKKVHKCRNCGKLHPYEIKDGRREFTLATLAEEKKGNYEFSCRCGHVFMVVDAKTRQLISRES